MGTARWMEQANKAPVHEVFVECGLEKIGNGYGPCPECGAEKRGSKDKRGAIKINAQKTGWACIACGVKGDLLNLLGFCQYGKTLKDLDDEGRDSVRDWFASRGWCDGKDAFGGSMPPVAPPPSSAPGDVYTPPNYPPPKELKRFWDASKKINGSLDQDVRAFFRERRWDPKLVADVGACRISPQAEDLNTWPAWWPQGRASTWRLLVPAFTTDGVMTSIQGRATTPVHNGSPKVLWPKGCDAVDLIMPDTVGWLFLKGRLKPKLVIICEGLTDRIALSIHKAQLGKNVAILGCASGGFKALGRIEWPKWTPIYSVTDPDEAGDLYNEQIATAISPAPLRRLILSPDRNDGQQI